jgi:hypothetical protein
MNSVVTRLIADVIGFDGFDIVKKFDEIHLFIEQFFDIEVILMYLIELEYQLFDILFL